MTILREAMKMTNERIRVLIEEYDAVTGYAIAMQELDNLAIQALGTAISKDLLDHPDTVIELDDALLSKIDIFPAKTMSSDTLFRLEVVELPKDLPYLDHTNRELALMKAGKKPLAVFSGWEISELEESIYLRLFDPLVESGELVRQEYKYSADGKLCDGSRFDQNFTILYASKNESWRIKAYQLLRNTVAHTGLWSNDYERLFGTLLGYSDIENDAWLRRRKVNGLRWGFATLYSYCSSLATQDSVKDILSDGYGPIEICISEEGIGPALDRLRKNLKRVNLLRFHMPYRQIGSFYSICRNTGDQFGPFKVEEKNIFELASLLEGCPEIVEKG